MKPILFITRFGGHHYMKKDYDKSPFQPNIRVEQYNEQGWYFGTMYIARGRKLRRQIKLLKRKIK